MDNTIVIIPTFNEAENIAKVLAEVFAAAPDVSVLVVDDASPDGTARIVRELQTVYPRLMLFKRPGKEGLGTAYIAAFRKILAEYPHDARVITMDADLSHDPRHIPEMVEQSRIFDVVIGSRYVSGGGTSGWELWRRLLSRGGNIYARAITGLSIKDCTGGFNCIALSYIRKINLSRVERFTGYSFIFALKFFLKEAGATFCEIPIIFANRRFGDSKISHNIIAEGILAPWRLRFH